MAVWHTAAYILLMGFRDQSCTLWWNITLTLTLIRGVLGCFCLLSWLQVPGGVAHWNHWGLWGPMFSAFCGVMWDVDSVHHSSPLVLLPFVISYKHHFKHVDMSHPLTLTPHYIDFRNQTICFFSSIVLPPFFVVWSHPWHIQSLCHQVENQRAFSRQREDGRSAGLGDKTPTQLDIKAEKVWK